MALTVIPQSGATFSDTDVETYLGSWLRSYFISGFVPAIGSGLNVKVTDASTVNYAMIKGHWVTESTNSNTVTVSSGTTSSIWLQLTRVGGLVNGVQYAVSATDPGDAIKICYFVSGGSTIISVTDARMIGAGMAPPSWVSPTAPPNPSPGDFWLNSSTNGSYIRDASNSTWVSTSQVPTQSKLASYFQTSSNSLVDTGLTVTTAGPSCIMATLQTLKSGITGTYTLHLTASSGNIYYMWLVNQDGYTTHGFQTFTAFNADIIPINADNVNTDIILIGYSTAAATIKIQVDVQGGSDTLYVNANSQLVAYT